jgi:hypothetical protein
MTYTKRAGRIWAKALQEPVYLTKTELSIIINALYAKLERKDAMTDRYREQLIRLYQKLKDTTI